MHAVVLVGGFGTRLRPLTYAIPKPLLPVAHVPMIRRLVNRLAEGGVTDVVLALGFKPEPFFAEFPNNMCGNVRMSYAVESTPLVNPASLQPRQPCEPHLCRAPSSCWRIAALPCPVELLALA